MHTLRGPLPRGSPNLPPVKPPSATARRAVWARERARLGEHKASQTRAGPAGGRGIVQAGLGGRGASRAQTTRLKIWGLLLWRGTKGSWLRDGGRPRAGTGWRERGRLPVGHRKWKSFLC